MKTKQLLAARRQETVHSESECDLKVEKSSDIEVYCAFFQLYYTVEQLEHNNTFVPSLPTTGSGMCCRTIFSAIHQFPLLSSIVRNNAVFLKMVCHLGEDLHTLEMGGTMATRPWALQLAQTLYKGLRQSWLVFWQSVAQIRSDRQWEGVLWHALA